jgi:hypothetical protein
MPGSHVKSIFKIAKSPKTRTKKALPTIVVEDGTYWFTYMCKAEFR